MKWAPGRLVAFDLGLDVLRGHALDGLLRLDDSLLQSGSLRLGKLGYFGDGCLVRVGAGEVRPQTADVDLLAQAVEHGAEVAGNVLELVGFILGRHAPSDVTEEVHHGFHLLRAAEVALGADVLQG